MNKSNQQVVAIVLALIAVSFFTLHSWVKTTFDIPAEIATDAIFSGAIGLLLSLYFFLKYFTLSSAVSSLPFIIVLGIKPIIYHQMNFSGLDLIFFLTAFASLWLSYRICESLNN
ncbi:membrane hypothetical protein [Vibrio chagasii]|nr:membrane hypothetical protein [Vibrio chagasii]CAH6948733.1 membrane hypothetical protein [Vibrio chagasii]